MKSSLRRCLWQHFKREEFTISIIKEKNEKKTKSREVRRRKGTTKPKGKREKHCQAAPQEK